MSPKKPQATLPGKTIVVLSNVCPCIEHEEQTMVEITKDLFERMDA
jgi:hypothetical protein